MEIDKTLLPIILCLFIKNLLVKSEIIVTLPNGQIIGTKNITRENTKFFSFYALRYAQPPVEKLRFELPREELPWQDIYDATKEKNICYQVTRDSDLESEDCLFTNVFTPKDLQSKNVTSDLAVMVFIHGGGFVAGDGYQANGGPKFFMDHGVILVTFNYRLGPFGFLSTGDHVIPGNTGLKDQVQLLKWVQKNIQYFGGDPKKVTIFGQSSGGGSVGYLVLSPLAKGLFRAAIHQSGSGLSPLAYQRNQVNITYLTAAQINPKFAEVKNQNSTELLNVLRNIPAKDLDKASFNVTNMMGSPITSVLQLTNGFYYAPVIESKHYESAFVTDNMYSSFENGLFNKVPVILGVNGDEALAFLAVKGFIQNVSANYDNHSEYLVSENMHITNLNQQKLVGNLIKSYFTQDSSFEKSPIYAVKFHTSHNLEKPIIKQAELQAKYVHVRVYQFNYSGKMGNNPDCVFPGTSNVTHSEELNYLFSKAYSSEIPDNTDLSKFPEQDRIVHKRLIKLWTNFAKYLDPTPKKETLFENQIWPTAEVEGFKFLSIQNDLVIQSGFPNSKTYKFWNCIYGKYASKPYDSY